MSRDQITWLKELEAEDSRFRREVLDVMLDTMIATEAARENL